MAKVIVKPTLDVKVTIELDEEEARALDDLAGYGTDAFIKAFYNVLGEVYMKKHENGLRRFLNTIRECVNPAMFLVDNAREEIRNKRKVNSEHT